MASVQALKEVHIVHTVSAKACTYKSTGGRWILPSENNPKAELVEATTFGISGSANLKLKRRGSLTLEFEISLGDGTPSMKDGNVNTYISLSSDFDTVTTMLGVQDQINNMEPNSKSWVKLTLPAVPSFKTLSFTFQHQNPPTAIGGLTFYQAKVEEIGEE